MPEVLTWDAILAASLLVGFVNTHQRHASRFQGSSQAYLTVLMISTTLGWLSGLALFIYYFMSAGVLWTVVLFFVASLVAGLLFALLDAGLGLLVMSLASFLGWPAAALWLYSAIERLP